MPARRLQFTRIVTLRLCLGMGYPSASLRRGRWEVAQQCSTCAINSPCTVKCVSNPTSTSSEMPSPQPNSATARGRACRSAKESPSGLRVGAYARMLRFTTTHHYRFGPAKRALPRRKLFVTYYAPIHPRLCSSLGSAVPTMMPAPRMTFVRFVVQSQKLLLSGVVHTLCRKSAEDVADVAGCRSGASSPPPAAAPVVGGVKCMMGAGGMGASRDGISPPRCCLPATTKLPPSCTAS